MEPGAYQQMRVLQSTYWWFVARRRILASLIERFGLSPDAQILEAGCGPGGNFELLMHYGKLAAFDMDPEVVASCVEKYGIECVQGKLPEGHPFHDSKRFDLVVALDVIEHVEQDAESLRSLASCLHERGRLLVTVPAYQWMFSAHDRFHHHKRRYRLRTLRAIAESAGLEVEDAGYFNTLLFPAIAAVRLMARLRGVDPQSDAAMPGRLANRVLTAVFGSEALWLRYLRFPFGTSIYLVARAHHQPVAS